MNITPIIQAVFALLSAIITCFLIPLLREKFSADRLTTIRTWVRIAVHAAEQLFVGSGRGAEKKAYVAAFLDGKGFRVDMDDLNNMIEAAVLDLKTATDEWIIEPADEPTDEDPSDEPDA